MTVADYVPKHMKLKHAGSVVVCNHCGQSLPLDTGNDVLWRDDLHDFINQHTPCPPPLGDAA